VSWFSQIVDAAESFTKNVVDQTGGLLSPAYPTELGFDISRTLTNTKQQKTAGLGFDPYNGLGGEIPNQINAADIAPTIKNQLLQMQGKFDPEQIQAELRRAQAGEGKYASINRNYKAILFAADRPAAAQLFKSSYSRNNAANGLLSTNNTLLGQGT